MQWKIVLVYSLLSLLTMQFFGAYLIHEVEKYYINDYMSNMETQGNLLSNFLVRYFVEDQNEEDISTLIKEFSAQSGTEIMVLDSYGRVISGGDGLMQGRRILQEEVSRALAGSKGETIRIVPDTNVRQKFLAIPVKVRDNVVGVLYMTASLENIDNTVKQVQVIFMTGTAIVLVITMVLGFILAKTITRPIQEVTSRAAQMAKGDFEQKIEIKSEDEIGRLGSMFNHLTLRLKETLKEISAEKGKVEAILSYMTDGVVAISQEGDIIHLNPAAKEMLGSEFFKYFSKAELLQLLEEGRQDTREIIPTGSRFYIKAHLVPFRVPEGDQHGILVVLQDITKEQELNRIQQEFVANVSHELKTPLTTVKSYVETLLNGAMKEEKTCNNFLQVVEGETDRMVRLVKDLLVLSRLDYHQLSWHMEEVNLGDLLRETAQEFRFKYPPPAPGLIVELSPLPQVAIDRDKVKQILINVLSNAYKFTPPEKNIYLRAITKENEVLIYITDQGIGIPSNELSRVFERFYRVDKGRSRAMGGTGLGLSIARQLVEGHGGKIWADSHWGEGTTIHFTLPLEKGEERGEAL